MTRLSSSTNAIRSPVVSVGSIGAQMRLVRFKDGEHGFDLYTSDDGDKSKAPHQFTWVLSTRNANGNGIALIYK